ncbi:hypothetical protein Cs7R123_49340 [Catellatospora sp. TT07R-123]|uniref:hypothetical protein n=1 Tax=Catellatospora sp. TT07R-123 TaxID=2733863 RepID=UPI001B24D741|nr:hypothetical protein [Catellatospora sp. TT07R-123]GHJ47592.1 hypothetical protein Cs7R123_49340 [Catellatospora sp. TT07R-123]
MRTRIATLAAAVAALTTAAMLVVGIAAADPVPPSTPFPAVSVNPDVCKAEKIRVDQAQLRYNQALATYNRVLEAYRRGAASAQELRNAQKAVDEAALALNNARYAQAVCQNNAANPANKDCVNIALELNRLLDELAITKDLEALAKAYFEAAQYAYDHGAMSVEEYERIKTAYELAKLQTQLIEQLIADQRARAAAAGCKDVERPPASPSPSPSAPASPSPSPTTGPGPSSSPVPVPSGSASSTTVPATAVPAAPAAG